MNEAAIQAEGEALIGKEVWNPNCKELMNFWHDRTQKGDVYFVALAIVLQDGQVAYDYAGALQLETAAREVLATLTKELDMVHEAKKIGPRNLNLDASYVEYPCNGAPICFDFEIWMIAAEMRRRRLGAPAPLRVAFTHEYLLDEVGKNFLENVMKPLLPLIGAVEDPAAIGGHHNPIYVPNEICNAARAGEKVPILRAPQGAREAVDGWLFGKEPVTITLREARHWTPRNSNVEAWIRFAAELEDEGQPVIFIRDTAMANEPIFRPDGLGFAAFPMAAHRIDFRMAIYERAKCNFFVSNGPGGLALFSDRPYLYFVNIKDDIDYNPNLPGWWYKSNGIDEGEQWPWALPTQRMVWENDDYANIRRAWDELKAVL
jgi:hypothetical protein